MKLNLPVTQRDIPLYDNSLIVSKTDLKGCLTYVNRDFLNISGFAEGELIGVSHNVVRHPDMPSEAFQDLWATLKAGRPWVGLVKNRCKNGDHYWVVANVTPMREDGKVAGYLSVRTKATPEAINQAENAYRLFREGKAKGLAIRNGQVVRRGLAERIRRWQSDASLTLKGAVAMTVAILLVSGLSTLLIAKRAQTTLENQGLASITDKVHLVRQMIETNASAIRDEAGHLNALFAGEFHEAFSLDGTAGDGLPVLKNGGMVMNGRFNEVDAFTAQSSAIATLFARKDDEFLRVTTSLKKENGDRAVGTPLSHDSPAYAKLLAGESYVGRTVLFGKDVYASYSPIKDGAGKVIGATFIGRDFSAEMAVLKKAIAATKIGDTGYVYVVDATPGKSMGDLVVHPSKQGQNALAFKDAEGSEFVRQMIAMKQGSIRYPWLNKELGETHIREKVALFEYFPEWNWVLAGSTYMDEFEQAANALAWQMMLSTLAVVLVLTGVMYWLMHHLVTRPLQRAIGGFHEIAGGNYSAPVDTLRDDEVGKVFQGLKSMQVRLSFDVAEAKRVSDENLGVRFALESVTVPVTLADENNKLVFMNQAAEALWQSMSSEIAKRAPDFSIAAMKERGLAHYLEDEASRTVYRSALEESQILDIDLAQRKLRVTASPVKDQSGNYRGRVSQWIDRTAEVAVEGEVAALVESAAHGDFTRRVELSGKRGFHLRLSEGLNKLVGEVSSGLEDVARVLGAISRGVLTERMEGEFEGTFGQLKDDTNTTVERLREVLGRIQEATEAVNLAAQEIASGNADLSSRTEEQASSLQETASSMEEINATVKQNADNALQAKALAVNSNHVVVRSGAMVQKVVETMSAIQNSSKTMFDIIGVIDSIAFQTNILALNAAVEAARAGEQGRGFAVVASEVRNLAQRSAIAAKEIKTLIANSVNQVQSGVSQVQDAGRTMEDALASFQKVTYLVTEIATASAEQSAGVDQVTLAVSQMEEVTQQNAALVEEAAAAAESLEDQARSLARAVAVFDLGAKANTRGLTLMR